MDGAILTGIITAVTGLGGYVFGKRQRVAKSRKIEAEADGINISNVSKAVDIWEELVKSLKAELEQVKKEVSMLRGENQKLHKEVVALQNENQNLHREVSRLSLLIKQ